MIGESADFLAWTDIFDILESNLPRQPSFAYSIASKGSGRLGVEKAGGMNPFKEMMLGCWCWANTYSS